MRGEIKIHVYNINTNLKCFVTCIYFFIERERGRESEMGYIIKELLTDIPEGTVYRRKTSRNK